MNSIADLKPLPSLKLGDLMGMYVGQTKVISFDQYPSAVGPKLFRRFETAFYRHRRALADLGVWSMSQERRALRLTIRRRDPDKFKPRARPARLGGVTKAQLLGMKVGQKRTCDFGDAWDRAKLLAYNSHIRSVRARVSAMKREGLGQWQVISLSPKRAVVRSIFAFTIERVA